MRNGQPGAARRATRRGMGQHYEGCAIPLPERSEAWEPSASSVAAFLLTLHVPPGVDCALCWGRPRTGWGLWGFWGLCGLWGLSGVGGLCCGSGVFGLYWSLRCCGVWILCLGAFAWGWVLCLGAFAWDWILCYPMVFVSGWIFCSVGGSILCCGVYVQVWILCCGVFGWGWILWCSVVFVWGWILCCGLQGENALGEGAPLLGLHPRLAVRVKDAEGADPRPTEVWPSISSRPSRAASNPVARVLP